MRNVFYGNVYLLIAIYSFDFDHAQNQCLLILCNFVDSNTTFVKRKLRRGRVLIITWICMNYFGAIKHHFAVNWKEKRQINLKTVKIFLDSRKFIVGTFPRYFITFFLHYTYMTGRLNTNLGKFANEKYEVYPLIGI